MMKVALIADAHANFPAFDAVLQDIMKQKIEHIVFAGDAVGYYPFVNEVCLHARQHVSWAVKGNHDAFITNSLKVSDEKRHHYAIDYTLSVISSENKKWLEDLPESLNFELAGSVFKVFHGSPWNCLEEYIYPDNAFFDRFSGIDADFVILGHTHYPMVRQIGEIVIINPGSCGQPRDYCPQVSYAVLDTISREVVIRRVEYDIDKVIRLMESLKFEASAGHILTRKRQI